MSKFWLRPSLFGSDHSSHLPLRPPWAAAEASFTELCSRCGDCSFACPARIIIKGRAGFPEVNFQQGECTFCGACADSCQPQALNRSRQAAPWQLNASIDQQCISFQGIVCYRCQEACPNNSIRLVPQLGGYRIPKIDLSSCTACGACVAPCPSNAISIHHVLTQEIST